MLTEAEALQFVTNVLGLSHPLQKLEEDRLLFLNEIVRAYHVVIPFQNVDLLCLEEKDRSVPSWEGIKAAVMGGYGGLCYTLAVFMKFLLEALGYDVYFVTCTIVLPDTHIAVIVQNLLKPGSKHFIDFCGYPTFQAIPMDFHEESSVYYHSFLEYKFVCEDNYVLRCHWQGAETRSLVPGKELKKERWHRFSKIDLTPRDLAYFDQPMHRIYTDSKASSFLTSFRVVLFKNLKLTAIKNTSLLIEQSDRTLQETKLESREEMMKSVQKHFPLFPLENIRKAIARLNFFEQGF